MDSFNRPSLSNESSQLRVAGCCSQTAERPWSVTVAAASPQSQSSGEHLPQACTTSLPCSLATENRATLRVSVSSFFQSPKYGDGAGVSTGGGPGGGG